MRVLIVGGDGMLGHQLLRRLSARHEVLVTLRREPGDYASIGVFSAGNAFFGVDVRGPEAVAGVLQSFRPDAVVNAAGVIKQRGAAADPVLGIEVNSLFPHRLARMCRETGTRVIQYSTDCVFSGVRGAYTESDMPDPVDLYGRTKLLGELDDEHCVTIRTSMIGPELSRKTGLLEWFLAQKGSAPGYRRAVFSGLTTLEHARIVEHVLERRPWKPGVYHVSAAAISKFDLLCMVDRYFARGVEVVPDDSLVVDRSLDSRRFREDFNYRPPSWDEMIRELAGAMRDLEQ